MLKKLLLFKCILLLLSASCSVAEANSKVRRLSPNEGLSQSYVNNVLIDKKGYLWVATESGLNKYDGYQVVHVEGPNGELDEVMIDQIYQDSEGQIWIASVISGLFRYDPDTSLYRQYMPKTQTEEEIKRSVFAMLDIGDGNLWLGRGEDIARLNIETGVIETAFNLPNPSDRSWVRALFHHDGYLYIGTSEGAYVHELKSGETRALDYLASPPVSIHQHNVKSFALSEDSQLMVGTVYGLYKVETANMEAVFKDNAEFKKQLVLAERNIWKMITKPGFLRLATDKGLFDFDPKTHTLTKLDNIKQSGFILTDPSIMDMIEDPYGSMWVATKSDGAFYLPADEFEFKNFNQENVSGDGFSHHHVWASKYRNKLLWLGTNNGITALDIETGDTHIYLKDYGQDEYTDDFSVYEIHPYGGDLWLNTSLGLFRFDLASKTLHLVTASNAEQQKYLKGELGSAQLLSDGRLFMVNRDEGMFYIDLKNQRITPLNGDFSRFDTFQVQGFMPPLPGTPGKPLFFTGGQLYQVDVERERLHLIYEVPQQHDSLAMSLLSMVVDRNNILWLSLANYGLIGLDANTFQLRYINDLEKYNLGSLMYDMVIDDAGMIWLSSHKGIWRFNPDNMHFQQYTTEQGLDTNEFNSRAYTVLPDGRIVYGSVMGLTVFDPKRNRPSHPLIKQVNITSVELMSRDLHVPAMSPFRSIALEHDDIGLEVAFSAMSFDFQDRIVFEYQLSGERKTYTRNSNRVIFPTLSPGNYSLKVWAKDPFTGDYTAPAQLNIAVAYPLWRSPLAIFLYVLVCGAAVAGWIYRRNRVQRLLLAAHRESRESEARLKLALEGSHSGVWDWHSGSTSIYQPRLKNELGYEQESTSLEDYLTKIHPEERQKFRIEWLEFLSTDKGYFDCTYRLRHAAGHWRWYKDFGKVVSWHGGMPQKVAGTYTNMTRERVFEENARLFGAAFEQTRDWVLILDHKFRIRATNQALRDTFAFSHADKSSRTLTFGLSRDSRLNYLRMMAGLKQGEQYQGEELVRTASGKRVPVLLKISAVTSTEQKSLNYIVVLTDISAQKSASMARRQLGGYDGLTGLPNRTLMLDRAEHALTLAKRHGTQVAFTLINVRGFTGLNQRFGNLKADKLLVALAERLNSLMRDTDSLARLHDDEFLLMIEEVEDSEQMEMVCGRILKVLEAPFELDGENIDLSVNMGIAMAPQDGDKVAELLHGADIALFQARRNLKFDFLFFKPEFNQHMQRRRQMASDLAQACEEYDFSCEYELVYTAQGRIDALDVRLKWHRDGEKLAVESFLTVAAEAELVGEIGRSALAGALLELKTWRRLHPQLRLMLPLYAEQLQQRGVVSGIEKQLARYELPASALIFILEQGQLKDMQDCLPEIEALQQAGCSFVLDTAKGHGLTFEELTDLPIDALRLKEPHLFNEARADERAVTDAVISLVHGLGLKVYATGADSEQTRLAMIQAGADFWQGRLGGGEMNGDVISERLQLSNQNLG